MKTVVLSSKYQVVIPVELRERLGIKPGDRVRWYMSPTGLKLVRDLSMEDTAGMLDGRPVPPFEREKEHEAASA